MIDDVSHSRRTPLAFLERTALVFPGRTAVVDGERRFTSEIEFGKLPKTSTGKVKKCELRERRQRSS
ncbi:MAG: hypothetical protein ACXW0F_09895 [Gaiellaceae bacterium]